MIGIAYPQDSFSCPIDLRLPRNEKYACVAKCYSTIFENYKPYNPEEYNSDSSLPEDPDLYDSTIRSFIYELQNTGCLQYFCDIRYIRPEVCVIFESVAQAIKSGNVTDGGICKELNRSANGKPANLIKTRAARIICSEDIN